MRDTNPNIRLLQSVLHSRILYISRLDWTILFQVVGLAHWLTGDVEICDGQEDTESIKTLLSPGNPHLLPLNTSYTDISADKFAENNFYQLWTVYKERGGTLFCWQLDKTGHPAPPGRNHQEGGGGGEGGVPEVKIIIIVQIIQIENWWNIVQTVLKDFSNDDGCSAFCSN